MRQDQRSWRSQGFEYPRKVLQTGYSDRLLEGNNWCEGTTDAYAHYVCANKCTDDAFQNGIQWIIYGELSKDKSTLTLQFYHANEPFGKWIITCPNSQPTVLPWGLHGANVFLPEIVMPYADKASKTIPFGDLGEVTFTIKFAVN